MKITIDTTQDSKRDIQEAIRMLNALISQETLDSSQDTGILGNTNPDMFSIFDEKKEEQPQLRSDSLRIIEY